MGQPVASPAIISPVWQNGVPQSMQRAPWSRSFLDGNSSWNSPQSWMRSSGVRSGGSSRLSLEEARGFAHGPYLPPTRATSATLSSKAAISASSGREAGLAHLALRLQHAVVVVGHHAHEAGHEVVPVHEHLARARAARELGVAEDEVLHELDLLRIAQAVEEHHLLVAAGGEVVVFVEHVGDAAAHARREVAAGGAEHDDAAARHVLAAVVADRFHHRVHAAVAHARSARRPRRR